MTRTLSAEKSELSEITLLQSGASRRSRRRPILGSEFETQAAGLYTHRSVHRNETKIRLDQLRFIDLSSCFLRSRSTRSPRLQLIE
jgi:hypothetical protein